MSQQMWMRSSVTVASVAEQVCDVGRPLERWVCSNVRASEQAALVRALQHELETSARTAVDHARVHDAEPQIKLSKERIRELLTCERWAMATPESRARTITRELVVGVYVDVLAQHFVTTNRLDAEPLSLAESLVAASDDDAAAILAWSEALSAPDRAELSLELEELRAALLGGWPAIRNSWWPRTQERAVVELADGDVLIDGRMDVVLGGPPSGHPAAIVEITSRLLRQGDLDDLLLYSLLVAIRDEVPPALALMCSARGASTFEVWVGADELAAATGRLRDAITRVGELRGGRRPRETRSWACSRCPDRDVCPTGPGAAGSVGRGDDEPF